MQQVVRSHVWLAGVSGSKAMGISTNAKKKLVLINRFSRSYA